MSSVLVRNGAVLVANGSAISYQGTEYVINASTVGTMNVVGFSFASASISLSDLVLDESTYFWIEPTADVTVNCWQDMNDDDDFSITIPSGTKFICTFITDTGLCSFSGAYANSFGFFKCLKDVSENLLEFQSSGENPQYGGFVNGITYGKEYGCPHMFWGSTNWALHVVKIDSSSSINFPSASGVSF